MVEDQARSFCEKALREHLEASPTVHFLLDALRRSGCPLVKDKGVNFLCAPCTPDQGSGQFDSSTNKITICQNAIQSKQHVEDTINHELIHAYDNCRIVGGLQEVDCRQVACSEIRAANLSGDCKWTREFMRGNVSTVAGQHRICVRRRARLSLLASKCCRDCNADAVLDEIFESCYGDTAPFIDIP